MKTRREVLKWTAPVILAVTLPAHAQTSAPPKKECPAKYLYDNAPLNPGCPPVIAVDCYHRDLGYIECPAEP